MKLTKKKEGALMYHRVVCISNVEYRKRQYGEQPWMVQALEYEKDSKYFFCSATEFE